MSKFEAGLDGITFQCKGSRLLGGFYKGAGDVPRPTAILLHGLPGIEKHLDVAYQLRDFGWNCLYFHFRGGWGSQGSFSLSGLTEDTSASVEWIRQQQSVDKSRIVLIGASTGSYPALLHGASDPEIRAIIGISPVIEPQAFQFPAKMADEFAKMLNGITGQDLLRQWKQMISLSEAIQAFSPRPILLVAATKDDIFPPSQYEDSITSIRNIKLIQHQDSDHGFSSYRPWLVQTVTEWLVENFGR
jgi:alpha/beta superfamily hydrolase